jgi:hypothetical protein
MHSDFDFVRLIFLQAHRATDRFFADSAVLLSSHDLGFTPTLIYKSSILFSFYRFIINKLGDPVPTSLLDPPVLVCRLIETPSTLFMYSPQISLYLLL